MGITKSVIIGGFALALAQAPAQGAKSQETINVTSGNCAILLDPKAPLSAITRYLSQQYIFTDIGTIDAAIEVAFEKVSERGKNGSHGEQIEYDELMANLIESEEVLDESIDKWRAEEKLREGTLKRIKWDQKIRTLAAYVSYLIGKDPDSRTNFFRNCSTQET